MHFFKKILCVCLVLIIILTFGQNTVHSETFDGAVYDYFKSVSAGDYTTNAILGDGTIWEWGQSNILKNGAESNNFLPDKISDDTHFVSVSSGNEFTIALKDDGTVWCWGFNNYISMSSIPEKVAGLSDIVAISAGYSHAVALKNDGTVWTWGSNQSGELGDGTTTTSKAPVQVTDIMNVKMVSAGTNNSMALKEDGTVWIWGANGYKYSGNDSINRYKPLRVAELDSVAGVIAGASRWAVIKADGTVWSWGQNSNGILGDGTTQDRFVPVRLPGLSDIKMLSLAGVHTLALGRDGSVWSWGYNGDGELGDGTTIDNMTPTILNDISSVAYITAGNGYSIALKEDGTALAWGKNTLGQLGNNILDSKSTIPMQVFNPLTERIHDITACSLSASESHTLFVSKDGTVLAWGDNTSGELGNGTFTGSLAPVKVNNLTDVIAVSAGYGFSVALKNDGTVWTWGGGSSGRLGNGNENDQPVPTQIDGIDNIVAISAGRNFTLALRKDGTIWAWGMNDYIGDGVYKACKTEPVLVRGLLGVKAIAAGFTHSLALKEDNTVWSWGCNAFGELGDGTKSDKSYPGLVGVLSNVGIIRASEHSSMAIKNDGTVWAWGDNTYGQLGNGTKTGKDVPEKITGLENIKDISLGKANTISIKSDGTLNIWGNNNYGQICDGTTIERLSPVQLDSIIDIAYIASGGYQIIAFKKDGTLWTWGDSTYGRDYNLSRIYEFPTKLNNISDVKEVSIADKYYMALKNDGTVWAWGDNSSGQLGNGTTDSITKPIMIQGLSDVKSIASCEKTSLAVKNDGTVWAWGDNTYGLFGNGTFVNSNVPLKIDNFSAVKSISVGDDHVLAVKDDGTVWAWGANSMGQLGDGTEASKSIPIKVPGLIDISDVISEGLNSFAIKNDGALFGWGYSISFAQENGQHVTSPVRVSGLSNVKDMVLYERLNNADKNAYIYTVNKDGTVWKSILNLCAADNSIEQLSGLSDFKSITSTGLIKNDNTLYCWGDNMYGQLGDGTYIMKEYIVRVVGLTNVKSYSAFGGSSAAVTNDGMMYVWGIYNYEGIGVNSPKQIFPGNGPNNPENSTITPQNTSFDKNVSVQADIMVTMTLNGNTLTGIMNGSNTLSNGTDYSVNGSSITIKKSYLAGQPNGNARLTFCFSGGSNAPLDISIYDSTAPVTPGGGVTSEGNITPAGGGIPSSGIMPGERAEPVPKNGLITIEPVTDNNAAKADVSSDKYKELLDSAKEIQGVKNLTINLVDNGQSEYNIQLPYSALTDNSKKAAITIKTPVAVITLPSNMFAKSIAQDVQKIGISFAAVDKATLPSAIKDKVGNSPVIDIIVVIDGDTIVWNNPDARVTVSIPYILENGETGDYVTVYYIDSSGILVNMQGVYSPDFKMVTFTTTHFSRYLVQYNEIMFTDLKGYESYSKYIKAMASKDIITGVGNNRYAPGKVLTRAEFATLLARMFKLDTTGNNTVFTDVKPSDSYAPYVYAAFRAGLIMGIGQKRFEPNEAITMQDAAIILTRSLKLMGVGITSGSLSGIKDYISISGYARDAVGFILQKGIMSLDSKGNFNARSKVNRAMAAQFIYKVFYYYEQMGV